MVKENLYEPFEIAVHEVDACPKQGHQHSFFELVYIISGKGTQCINKNVFEYGPGHLFLITPDDCHSFEVETTTQFFFLRFNDIYIKNSQLQTEGMQRSDYVQRLEFILQHANHLPGCILKNFNDRCLVKPTVEAIVREYINRDLYNRELIQQLVNTLIIVVARNIAKAMPDKVDEATEGKALGILQYIQSNIYKPEKIRAEMISKQFGISETYLGRYFKKHTNETMQQYITNYKIKLVENRLLHSNMRMNEIAYQLSFTDESHLNKMFKKYKGLSPGAFKKQGLKLTASF